MIGVYRILNTLTGKSYIGQSVDIDKRFKEHLYHKQSPIDSDIHTFGEEFFKFKILVICDIDELDYWEEYYIEQFDSVNDGYNSTTGGRHSVGEGNSNCKLTELDVFKIREAYRVHSPKYEVYEKYKDKVSKSYFSNVWEGISWKDVHSDVYTDENKGYYKKKTPIGENGKNSIFSDEEVLKLRERYINETAAQIFESVKTRCTFQTLQCILWGRHYNHIPIYDKRNKKWINK